MSTPKRPLRPDEARLWQQVTGDVAPLTGKRAAPAKPTRQSKPTVTPERPAKPPAKPPAKSKPSAKTKPGAVKPPAPPAPPGVTMERVRRAQMPGLDRRNAERLRRGQMAIEGRLDLHGMFQDEAERALDRFLAQSAAAGKRCLLVITGKGSTPRGGDLVIPERLGVLRDAVPGWLAKPGNRRLIVATHPAARRHGGSGALYVLLRRRREPEP